MKINIIVLNADSDDFFEKKLSFNLIESDGSDKYIILYFENNCHFKLVGEFDGEKIITTFSKIPENLLTLEN